MSRFFAPLFLCVSLALVAGCATTPTITGAPRSGDASSFVYRLGAGDKVKVSVYGEDRLSGEFQVSDAGSIALPLVEEGDIKAANLSIEELRGAIVAKLKDGYLKDPRVTVEVTNFRPFYILGEVTRPGEYPYTAGLTVLNAVARAEGFTYRADTKHVFLKRAKELEERTLDLTTTTAVAPGDTVRIGERHF